MTLLRFVSLTISNNENSINSFRILLHKMFRDSLSDLVSSPPIHSICSSWSDIIWFEHFLCLRQYTLHCNLLSSGFRLAFLHSLDPSIGSDIAIRLHLLLYVHIEPRKIFTSGYSFPGNYHNTS